MVSKNRISQLNYIITPLSAATCTIGGRGGI
jgi:hypothetical protein